MTFGTFLAPHHPIGENPMLQLQSDLELAQHLDNLGFDEFWCGEHHSTGWEVIASPELFLAAAAERTQRIKLGTGVISSLEQSKKWLPFNEAKIEAQKIAKKLGIFTNAEWVKAHKDGKIPDFLPRYPRDIYKKNKKK
jgi:hypothetical protein